MTHHAMGEVDSQYREIPFFAKHLDSYVDHI